MKKTILILSCLIITGTGFYGCKKGEGDPMLSLHTRKGRLTGEWTLSEGKMTTVSGSSTSTSTYSGSTVTNTSGTTTSVGTYTYKLTIVKDGTWDVAYTETGTGFTFSQTTKGTWNWTGGVGDVKKKSQVAMTTLSDMSTTTFGTTSTTSNDTYTGSDAPVSVSDIFELKKKEMIMKGAGTSFSTSGTTSTTSSSTSEMTFVQK